MKQFQYSLGKARILCPSCGHRTFKPYVDTGNGETLDPSVGRCNRQFSCAYHKKPREYFAETGRAARPASASCSRPAPRLAPSLVPPALMAASLTADVLYSPVYRLLERNFSPATAAAVARLYFLGYHCRSNSTVFWILDNEVRCRSGKFMVYNMDGHRNRFLPYAFRWAHSQLKDFNYVAAFYGSHLIDSNRTVTIVESEKTALIVTAWLMERGWLHRYVVIATGGCSNISFDPEMIFDPAYKYYPVRAKKVLLIPDGDSVEKWRQQAQCLAPFVKSVRLWDIRPYCRCPSDDIADIILRRINR